MSEYCKEKVMEGFHAHRCSRKEWKDGFCRQHHPDSVAERLRKRDEAWDKQRKEAQERAEREREKAMRIKKMLEIAPILAEALENLVVSCPSLDGSYWTQEQRAKYNASLVGASEALKAYHDAKRVAG